MIIRNILVNIISHCPVKEQEKSEFVRCLQESEELRQRITKYKVPAICRFICENNIQLFEYSFVYSFYQKPEKERDVTAFLEYEAKVLLNHVFPYLESGLLDKYQEEFSKKRRKLTEPLSKAIKEIEGLIESESNKTKPKNKTIMQLRETKENLQRVLNGIEQKLFKTPISESNKEQTADDRLLEIIEHCKEEEKANIKLLFEDSFFDRDSTSFLDEIAKEDLQKRIDSLQRELEQKEWQYQKILFDLNGCICAALQEPLDFLERLSFNIRQETNKKCSPFTISAEIAKNVKQLRENFEDLLLNSNGMLTQEYRISIASCVANEEWEREILIPYDCLHHTNLSEPSEMVVALTRGLRYIQKKRDGSQEEIIHKAEVVAPEKKKQKKGRR